MFRAKGRVWLSGRLSPVEERGCEPPPAVSGELGVTPGMPIVCVGHICPELRFSLRAVCAAWSSLAADRVQSARVAVSSTDCRPCRIASTSPGRLELGAERHDQQHGKAADTLDGEVEQRSSTFLDITRPR